MRNIASRRIGFERLSPWLLPVLVTLFQWLTSRHSVTLPQVVLAGVLLWMPWSSYCRWRSRRESLVPLFAVVGAAHWLAFALLLFWGPKPAHPVHRVPYPEETVNALLVIAAVGVLALMLGMKVPLAPVRPASLPDLKPGRKTSHYLYIALGVGSVLGLVSDDFVLGFGSIRQFIELMRSVVPNTVFAILVLRYFRGTASPSDRLAVYVFTGARAVIGLASGWLSSLIALVMLWCFGYASMRRQMPIQVIALLVPAILFFQAGKEAFRNAYWYGGHTGSPLDKGLFWVDRSIEAWSDTLTGGKNNDRTASLMTETLSRVSLLDQAGNVYQKTPDDVPYQYGATYNYLLVTLIPRFVWPNKPSVNEANRFYQVAYGMSTKEQLQSVSIAVGFLMESFINFGWFGIVPVMFTIGLVLGLFERTLLVNSAGLLFNGIGMALLMLFVAIESQAAQYIAGLLQQIVLTVAVLAPVVRFRPVNTVVQRGLAAAV